MIVEITEDDIKAIGAALSEQMIERINYLWHGAFGISETSNPIEVLRELYSLYANEEAPKSVIADSFAAFLEVENYGRLYKRLITGKDYSDYLKNGNIEEFLF